MVEKYIKPYLDFYSVVYLPSLGCLYKINLGAKKASQKLFPPSFQYIFNESLEQPWQHFVLFVLQYENEKFEELEQKIEKEFLDWKKKLDSGQNIQIPEIGTLLFHNNHYTIQEFETLSKSYGYPIF